MKIGKICEQYQNSTDHCQIASVYTAMVKQTNGRYTFIAIVIANWRDFERLPPLVWTFPCNCGQPDQSTSSTGTCHTVCYPLVYYFYLLMNKSVADNLTAHQHIHRVHTRTHNYYNKQRGDSTVFHLDIFTHKTVNVLEGTHTKHHITLFWTSKGGKNFSGGKMHSP